MNTDFQFANPWLLGLLLVVAALALKDWTFLPRKVQSRGLPATLSYAAASMARGLPRSWRVTLRPLLASMRVAAIVLMVLALARPQIVQGKETIKGEGVDMALAVDISGSMAALDFQPSNRLEAAKAVIADFVAKRPYDRIGLVAFASEAFNQVPLTLDRNAFARSRPGQAGHGPGHRRQYRHRPGHRQCGQHAGAERCQEQSDRSADRWCQQRRRDRPADCGRGRQGAGHQDLHHRGAAKPGQVPVPVTDGWGNRQIAYQESQIDEETLRKVAETTGGQYFRAEDTQGLQAIYDAINNLEKSKVEVDVFNQYQELAGWLLAPALLLLVAEVVLSQTIFRKVP